MKTKLFVPALVLFMGAAPAFAEVYQLIKIQTSLPTIGIWVGENPVDDDGDVISQLGREQAWFCFDLTEIPDSEQIISASFHVRMRDFAEDYPTERTLWYDTDDSWWDSWPHDPDLEGVRTVDELVGVILFDENDWAWTTFDIDIGKHDWSNDLADNYVTLMLTGPESGFYSAAEVDFRQACLELVTMPAPEDVNVILNLGPEEFVQADGIDIEVPGYSVPSFVDWNNDMLNDLIVGEGGGFEEARVRVYLNVGTESEPQFSDYFYAQSNGSDLTCPASGCLGCFPRVDYWDEDDRKDLIVGRSDGKIEIFLNIGTDEEPTFGNGTELMAGDSVIDVGSRATPTVVDWNNDGAKDLVVGALDGKIHIFTNCGCGGIVPPSFDYSSSTGTFAQEDGDDLIVPGRRSSPQIMDLDGDGKKDILTGNTDGELLLYSNVGTDIKPQFSGYTLVEAGGDQINLPGTPRSRPFVCYWTGDGYYGPIDIYPDVLIGSGDGKIRLYRGISIPGDFDENGEVDFEDFALLAEHWKHKNNELGIMADLNGDGYVDHDDLSWFVDNWLVGTE
jgi:hypothetical protein